MKQETGKPGRPKSRRILAGALILLPLVILLYYAWLYIASERYLRSAALAEGFDFVDRRDAAFIEHGRHVAPTLSRYARDHDAATIEAAVRQGIGSDGKALWSMPSYNFALLSDEDMSALIAFLESAPVVEKKLPGPKLGWEARTRIVRGEAQHMAEWADRMPPLLLRADDELRLAHGEYIAKTTCNECHGFDLRGQVDIDQSTPDLAILAAYSDADFRRLMAFGEGIGGRTDLGLMTMVARDRFAYFDDHELDDLLAYLRTLPGTPVDGDAAWRQLR